MVALANVQFGKENADVRTVQKALIARGHTVPDGATGFFGEHTEAAYLAEQLAQGFTGTEADGIPGCASLTTLGRNAGFSVDCAGVSASGARPAAAGRVPSPVPGHKVTFAYFERGPYAWKPDGVGRHTGQPLGKVGTAGNVTGPHLHFEMSKGPSGSCGNVAKPTW